MGNIVPDALLQAGISVERHGAHFAPATPDAEWLPIVGEPGWLVLTHNKKQRYTPLERDAVMRSHVGLFVLVGHMSHADLAANVVRTMGRIVAFREKHEPPFIAKVYRAAERSMSGRPGRVTLWLSREEWLRMKR